MLNNLGRTWDARCFRKRVLLHFRRCLVPKALDHPEQPGTSASLQELQQPSAHFATSQTSQGSDGSRVASPSRQGHSPGSPASSLGFAETSRSWKGLTWISSDMALLYAMSLRLRPAKSCFETERRGHQGLRLLRWSHTPVTSAFFEPPGSCRAASTRPPIAELRSRADPAMAFNQRQGLKRMCWSGEARSARQSCRSTSGEIPRCCRQVVGSKEACEACIRGPGMANTTNTCT